MGRGLASGPRYNPGARSIIGLSKWPRWPGCCLAQRSNLALGQCPELRIPALWRCGEGKGHPEQCGHRWLPAHENRAFSANTDLTSEPRSYFKAYIRTESRRRHAACLIIQCGLRSATSRIQNIYPWNVSRYNNRGPSLCH